MKTFEEFTAAVQAAIGTPPTCIDATGNPKWILVLEKGTLTIRPYGDPEDPGISMTFGGIPEELADELGANRYSGQWNIVPRAEAISAGEGYSSCVRELRKRLARIGYVPPVSLAPGDLDGREAGLADLAGIIREFLTERWDGWDRKYPTLERTRPELAEAWREYQKARKEVTRIVREDFDRISGESPALQQGSITGERLTGPDLGLMFGSREAGLAHLVTVAREFVAEQDDRRPVSDWVYPGLKHALELIDREPGARGVGQSPAFTPDERQLLLDLLKHERADIGYKVENARAAGLGFARVKAEEAGALLDGIIGKLEN